MGREGSGEPQGGAPARRGVDLLATGEVEVEGPAGTDLVHLLAELLDNAAAYSPPTAPIVVTGAGDGDDYLIEVADRGIGMPDQELAWANQRLASDATRAPASQAAGDRLGPAIAARGCSGSTTWPTGCAAPPRPCSPWPAPSPRAAGPARWP